MSACPRRVQECCRSGKSQWPRTRRTRHLLAAILLFMGFAACHVRKEPRMLCAARGSRLRANYRESGEEVLSADYRHSSAESAARAHNLMIALHIPN